MKNKTGVDLKKRYWLIMSLHYYPNHGLDDVKYTSNDLEEVKRDMAREVEDCPSYSEKSIDIFDADERDYILRYDGVEKEFF